MEASLFAALESGALLLTAGRRLARWHRAAYDRAQRAAGLTAWPSPSILLFTAWLEREWLATGGRVLGAAQEQWLWEDIIAAENAGPLLDLAATARAAATAWALALAWQLPRSGPAWRQSEETEAFQRWATIFERRCRQLDMIPSAGLADAVAGRLAGTAFPPLILAGFDAFSLAQQALFDRLRAHGATISVWTPTAVPAVPTVTALAGTDAEWQAAAAWAASELDRGQPGPVAVVVPDLGAHRASIEAAFRAALEPGAAAANAPARRFHLSLGLPLAEYPLVTAALQLLSALGAPAALRTEAVLELVRSPFLQGSLSEAATRAALEPSLRRAQRTHIALDQLRPFLSACPRLDAALAGARQLVANWPRPATWREWANRFEQLLGVLGWPGEAPLSSAEFQTVTRWRQALDELASLDQLAPAAPGIDDALRLLRSIAAARTFQPEAPAGAGEDAPVQVLGWLEAAGMSFPALWLAGLTDSVLPPAPRPHPFLPIALQHEHGVPVCSPDRQLHFARQLLDRLCRSGGSLRASFPAHDDDIELRPSPLLAAWPRQMIAGDAPPGAGPTAPAAAPAVAIETVSDPYGPGLGHAAGGGHALLTDQSACAFLGFARHRLGAAAWADIPAGLGALTRGSILHQALTLLWRQLGSRARLLEISAADLDQLITQATEGALARAPLHGRAGLAAAERDHLRRRIHEWLEQERKRREDFVVQALEEPSHATFAGLELDLRVDRVDVFADGSRLLLDYKSGQASRGGWRTARPVQPQLPLYFLTDPHPESVSTIAFAQLEAGDMALKQAAVDDPNWGGAALWRAGLTELGGQLVAGYAALNPRPGACQSCDLGPLCRVASWRTGEPEAEENEVEDHELAN